MKLRSTIGALALTAAICMGGLRAQTMRYYGDNLFDETGQVVLEDPGSPGSYIIAASRDGSNYVFRINPSGTVTHTRRFKVSDIDLVDKINDLRVDATGNYLLGVGVSEPITPRSLPPGGILYSPAEPKGGYVFKMRLSDLWVEWTAEIDVANYFPGCHNPFQRTFEPAAILDASSTDGKYYIYGTQHYTSTHGGPPCDVFSDEQFWSCMWIKDNGTLLGTDDYIRNMDDGTGDYEDAYRNHVESAVLGYGNKTVVVGNRDNINNVATTQKSVAIVSYAPGSMLYTDGSSKHYFATDVNPSSHVFTVRDVITLCGNSDICRSISVGGNTTNGRFTIALHDANSNTSLASTNNAVLKSWEFQGGGNWRTEAYEVVLDYVDATSIYLVVMGKAVNGDDTDIFMARVRLAVSGTNYFPVFMWAKRYGQSTVDEGFFNNPQSQLIKATDGHFVCVAQCDLNPGTAEKDIFFVKADPADGTTGGNCEANLTFTYLDRATSRGFSAFESGEKPPVTFPAPSNKFGGPAGGFMCGASRLAPESAIISAADALYPNPTVGAATLHYTNAAAGAEAVLMDIRGGAVRSWVMSGDAGNLELGLENLPQGIYLLSYPTLDGGRKTHKLVIQ